MQHLDHGRFFEAHQRAFREGDRRRHAHWLTGKTSLPKEITKPQDGKNRFFAVLGDDPQLDFAFLDVEDSICGISLGENRF
jgi:hypothetical protein